MSPERLKICNKIGEMTAKESDQTCCFAARARHTLWIAHVRRGCGILEALPPPRCDAQMLGKRCIVCGGNV